MSPLYLQQCIKRVTQNLINCEIKIISRTGLKDVAKSVTEFSTLPWNKHEKEAAYYYEKLGYKVIRLEHFISDFVGRKEHLSKESETLGNYLRRHLPKKDYDEYINRHESISDFRPLNGVDPKHYSIAFYPPDFLVGKPLSGEWKFVEVKGPKDHLHFRQANWYINLMPKTWKYEIFASLDRPLDKDFLFRPETLDRAGSEFEAAYQEKLKDVHKFQEFYAQIETRKRNK